MLFTSFFFKCVFLVVFSHGFASDPGYLEHFCKSVLRSKICDFTVF